MDYLLYIATLIALTLLVVIFYSYLRRKYRRNINLSPGVNLKGDIEIKPDNGKQPFTQNEAVLAAGLTDCGLFRKNNEDNFLIIPGCSDHISLPLFCAVADGMGGKDYGELASSKAIEILRGEFNKLKHQTGAPPDWKDWLRKTFLAAQLAVTKKSSELKKSTIGTTLVAAVVTGEKAIVANVGDSRAYLLRDGDLKQITRDHSLVSLLVEKQLIEPDEIYTHPRRSEIMRFLGQSTELEVDVFELGLIDGDILMLCSDGLWEMVRDPLMKDILVETPNLSDACTKLIKAANQAGGKDNITVINVKIR